MVRDYASSPSRWTPSESISKDGETGRALFPQQRWLSLTKINSGCSLQPCIPDSSNSEALPFSGRPRWSSSSGFPFPPNLSMGSSSDFGTFVSSHSFVISPVVENTLREGNYRSLRSSGSGIAGTSNSEGLKTLECSQGLETFSGGMVAYQPQENSTAVRSVKLLVAGGLAGAIARTCTAPLDRIKLLFQVQALGQGGTNANSYTGVWQALSKIYREEGIRAYWKGNFTNIIRIVPYSASQFMSHEQYKQMLAGPDGKLTPAKRLVAGAMAGITCSALTHPLDTVRLRLAMPNSGYSGMTNALITITTTEGYIALYKGLAPTLIGIAPYAALNFASYDMLKNLAYGEGKDRKQQSVIQNLLIGGAAGTFATTVCYPLDTIRRRMQMKGKNYTSIANAFTTMARTEGIRSFYKGWAANTIKVIPQNSIRFVSFEIIKNLIGVQGRKTDT